ncbi:hypothetical protein ACH5RR_021286 [Cinchona calisaya]|uniref:Uncharacterized protein n=1 Tax=Cinchona calisaya TaxID=153742 RepID=A0ABD2ZGW8_9GENT
MKRQRSSSSGKDRISELTDEILASIVSLLTMKEAGRTSVVSRRWIEMWKFYNGDLDFDGSSTLARYAREGNMGGAGIAWYRSWVDQVLNSHKGLEIEKFKVRYGLEKRHKDDIDRWINFPSSLLSPLAVSNLSNLTRLCLASVDITEDGIAYFLANCSSLQKLIVRCAISLVNLKIYSHSLRFLEYVLETLSQHPLLLSQVKILTLDLTFMFKIAEWARCERLFDFRDEDERKTWGLEKHFQPTLKIVEFVGWHGLEVDSELAMFIIEHAVLQKVILNPCNPRAFEELLPSIEAEEEEEIGELARERARQLGKRLPPGVELVIM